MVLRESDDACEVSVPQSKAGRPPAAAVARTPSEARKVCVRMGWEVEARSKVECNYGVSSMLTDFSILVGKIASSKLKSQVLVGSRHQF